MRPNKFLIFFAYMVLMLVACTPAEPRATPTLPDIHLPTHTLSPSPQPVTATLTSTSTRMPTATRTPTVTATPRPPQRTLVLPGNLILEEYHDDAGTQYTFEDDVELRHPSKKFYHYQATRYNNMPFRVETSDLIVESRTIYNEFRVILNDDTILYYYRCNNPSVAGNYVQIVNSVTFGSNWAVEHSCDYTMDIVLNGYSLNETKVYEYSTGLHLFDGKLFYLFKKNARIGVYYDGKEMFLDYDRVWQGCCESPHPPYSYDNMLVFYVSKDDDLFYLAVGFFGNK